MPYSERAAIQVLSRHVRQLTSLTDDPEALHLLLACSDQLADRAYELAHKQTDIKKEPNP